MRQNDKARTTRLINAEELKDRILNKRILGMPAYNAGLLDAGYLIAAMPTVDAVPVVRCKDCIWASDDDTYEIWCNGRGCPAQQVPADGYCDKGKRREECD